MWQGISWYLTHPYVSDYTFVFKFRPSRLCLCELKGILSRQVMSLDRKIKAFVRE